MQKSLQIVVTEEMLAFDGPRHDRAARQRNKLAGHEEKKGLHKKKLEFKFAITVVDIRPNSKQSISNLDYLHWWLMYGSCLPAIVVVIVNKSCGVDSFDN
ncbi:hypothetical protein OUZ56_001477 [Daphnia magna]|uniref:Uncharacterized protein n=1 Tax=Daphnia magna TaxID=35525 RepID=A0ABR0A2S3_9CRUS|nr:hypothetical protein OUZ56_001477 [Daphnia magna]